IVYRANSKGLELSITPEYLWDLFLNQNRKCAISGVELVFADSHKNKTDSTASPDRIDPSKGYIEDNVQWVHKYVNSMRNNKSINDFIEWCKIISDFNR